MTDGTTGSVMDRMADAKASECEWYFCQDRKESVADCVVCDDVIHISHGARDRQDEGFRVAYFGEEEPGSLDGERRKGWVCSANCLCELSRSVDTDPDD